LHRKISGWLTISVLFCMSLAQHRLGTGPNCNVQTVLDPTSRFRAINKTVGLQFGVPASNGFLHAYQHPLQPAWPMINLSSKPAIREQKHKIY
jgi:hypothetical protein